MGLKANADGSGAVQVGGSDAITITSGLAVSLPTGNFAFNSGYGSAATAYGCRAWVNFNGTGTVAIRASGNVTSITDNGTGDYTVNFTNAMPDANFSTNVSAYYSTGTSQYGLSALHTLATGSVRVVVGPESLSTGAWTASDSSTVCVNIFR